MCLRAGRGLLSPAARLHSVATAPDWESVRPTPQPEDTSDEGTLSPPCLFFCVFNQNKWIFCLGIVSTNFSYFSLVVLAFSVS